MLSDKVEARGAWRAITGFLVLACALAVALRAQQRREPAGVSSAGQVGLAAADSTVPLFVVMAAINAAGYDADLDSPLNSPIRKQVRADIAATNPPSLAALRTFYAAHRSPVPSRDLSQWVSFALLIGGPPDFAFRVKDAELPPEVSELRDLRPLLAAFYQDARLEQLWQKYRRAYEVELTRYDEGLGQAMLEVNGYLRLGSSSFLGRDFSIFMDLLGAPNQTNARSFGRDYYVVASPSARPQLDEVRHGYLHYVLEPMSLKYNALVMSKAALKEMAADAPALDPVLKANFRLLLSESLIRATELRMARMALGAKQARLAEIQSEGHILAPYFFEALEEFEKQEAGMRLYYPDLVEKLDVRREQRRLANVTFRAAPVAASVPHELALSPDAAPGPEPGAGGRATAAGRSTSEEERLLAQGEDALARQQVAQAQQFFQSAAQLKGPLEGSAIYGLALVATQQRQPELAKTYFQQAIDLSRDSHVVAWANIYLGRIFDMEENRELAVKYYQQALKSGDSDPAAKQAAESGLREPFRWEQRKNPANDSTKP